MNRAEPNLAVRPTSFSKIAHLREAFRQSFECQFVRDSILSRGLATPYIVTRDATVVGYAGVWSKHFPDRIMEFYVDPMSDHLSTEIFYRLITSSRATSIEAQTNIPKMYELARAFCRNLEDEKLLFESRKRESTSLDEMEFRARAESDESEVEGEWVVVEKDQVVAAGGVLTHYNPPYADIYMEVRKSKRRRGIGSFLVQELCRVCTENGLYASARCDADNIASQNTLLRGGMTICGRLVSGQIANLYLVERSTA